MSKSNQFGQAVMIGIVTGLSAYAVQSIILPRIINLNRDEVQRL